MKYCNYCGRQIPDDAAYCTSCGAKVATEKEPVPKHCAKCGNVLDDDAIFCKHCGNPTISISGVPYVRKSETHGLDTAIKVMMIIGTIMSSLMGYIIPLAWCLPMTISAMKKINNNEPISVGFKVCTLLFVNTVAGILMLCRNDG